MNHKELIDDLKGRINPQYVDCKGTESYERKQCLDAIESLLAEKERLNHNLTSTEQTMREYQELAATRLEEIERLKEIEQTNDALLEQLGDKNAVLLDQVASLSYGHEFFKAETNRLIAELKDKLAKYRDAPVVAWQWLDTANFRSKLPKNADRSEWNQLIVKPGE